MLNYYPFNYVDPPPSTFFQDNLISRYVPAMYQTGEFNGLIQLLQIFAPILDELHDDIIKLPNLVDPYRCPPEFLQYLSNLLGFELDASQSIDFNRSELRKGVEIESIRGTSYSFNRILKYQGGLDYGLFIPATQIIFLDIHPLDVSYDTTETNELGELCSGTIVDFSSQLNGSNTLFTLPYTLFKSQLILKYNGKIIQPGVNTGQYTLVQGLIISTNFIPKLGDSLIAQVVGDPYFGNAYYTEDASYWRPGTEDVWSDVNPLSTSQKFEDVQPLGTLLYYTFRQKFKFTSSTPGDLIIAFSILSNYQTSASISNDIVFAPSVIQSYVNSPSRIVDWSSTTYTFDSTSIYFDDIGGSYDLILVISSSP